MLRCRGSIELGQDGMGLIKDRPGERRRYDNERDDRTSQRQCRELNQAIGWRHMMGEHKADRGHGSTESKADAHEKGAQQRRGGGSYG